MSRADVDRDIEGTLGILATFFKEIPGSLVVIE